MRLARMEFDAEVDKGREEQHLESLTKADLIEYAETNGIEIDKTARKAEILENIKNELR